MRSLPPSAVPAIFLLFLIHPGSSSAQTVLFGEAPSAGSEEIDTSAQQYPCVPSEFYTLFPDLSRPAAPAPDVPLLAPDSMYSWPLGNALHDDLILVNYVDDDVAVGSVRDYLGLPHSYDGHRGTDITLLNFRQMDRGMPVLAAADGVVLVAEDGHPDRNIAAGSFPANYVLLDHGNGTRSLYFHLRRGSTAVKVGEAVRRGQLLGLAGSSGSSTDAHLHFETYVSYAVRDPWSGTFNSLPSLWVKQEPYVGTAPLRVYDMGVFTGAALAAGLTPLSLKEKISQPAVFGAGEPLLGVWLQFQAQMGNSYRIDVRRPDGSPFFTTSSGSLAFKLRYGWHYWYWNLARPIPESSFGTWKVTVTVAGNVVRTLEFTVGAQTIYPPRFWPIAGRSFHLDGGSYRDTLRVDPLGGPAAYSLRNAPYFVSLSEDSVITIDTPLTPRDRSVFFQAIASNPSGLQDTMWYHLVDLRAPPWVFPARVFLKDGHRTITALVPDAPASTLSAPICVRIEPVDDSYANVDVDLASIRMISHGSGAEETINALLSKHVPIGDTDGNGVAELPACFALGDVARLFSSVTGRQKVAVTIEADVAGGGRLRGGVELTVVGTETPLAVVVAPNPSNPEARLTFETRRPGPLKAMLFDLSGRLVRRLLDDRLAPAGRHEVRLNGRGEDGKALASGVYFYRIEAVEGVASGRFALIK